MNEWLLHMINLIVLLTCDHGMIFSFNSAFSKINWFHLILLHPRLLTLIDSGRCTLTRYCQSKLLYRCTPNGDTILNVLCLSLFVALFFSLATSHFQPDLVFLCDRFPSSHFEAVCGVGCNFPGCIDFVTIWVIELSLTALLLTGSS